MSSALLTIGITCYREGALLRECWQSVLGQTDDRWVAVIVMDGDADEETREVFESIDHPNIRRKHSFGTNVGPYPVRNKAFEITETPYHFFLDGDDMLPAGGVAAMYRALRQHPEAAHIYGDYLLFPSKQRLSTPRVISDPSDLLRIPAGHGLIAVTAWRALGGFSNDFARGGSDLDFKISLFESECGMFHCGDLFYVYRQNRDGSVTSKRSRTYAEVNCAIVGRHPRFFSDTIARRSFLYAGYGRSVYANLVAGDRTAARRYILRGIRDLGFTHGGMSYWLLRYLVGERVHGLAKRLLGLFRLPVNQG